jgi:hypothetical protein
MLKSRRLRFLGHEDLLEIMEGLGSKSIGSTVLENPERNEVLDCLSQCLVSIKNLNTLWQNGPEEIIAGGDMKIFEIYLLEHIELHCDSIARGKFLFEAFTFFAPVFEDLTHDVKRPCETTFFEIDPEGSVNIDVVSLKTLAYIHCFRHRELPHFEAGVRIRKNFCLHGDFKLRNALQKKLENELSKIDARLIIHEEEKSALIFSPSEELYSVEVGEFSARLMEPSDAIKAGLKLCKRSLFPPMALLPYFEKPLFQREVGVLKAEIEIEQKKEDGFLADGLHKLWSAHGRLSGTNGDTPEIEPVRKFVGSLAATSTRQRVPLRAHIFSSRSWIDEELRQVLEFATRSQDVLGG